MTRLRYQIRNLFRTRGYEIVKISTDGRAENLLALHSTKLFQHLGVNCVLDVGAHVGGYGTWLRNNGYAGAIVSFEPVSANFELLERRIQGDVSWTAHRFALGSRDENREINVTNATNFSSFFTPTDFAHAEFGDLPTVKMTETVGVRRLDGVFAEVVPRLSNPRIYLKLDTQGWDLEVLKGASGCLDHVVAVQSEISMQALYGGMPGFAESIKALGDLGFTLSGLFPVVLDSSHAVIELDCVAVRK